MPDETTGFPPETGQPTRYRRKPIALEARQVCSPLGHEVAQWCGSKYDDVLHQIPVQTLEGWLMARSGDWIVKGAKGEFWPVRGDVFAETYEPAETPGDGMVLVSRGAELVAAERHRQITGEGWNAGHDAHHDGSQLARAAACYALHAAGVRHLPHRPLGDGWPWPSGWDFKPDADPVRTLAKAGALIAAEIDRLSAAAEVTR